MPLVANEIKAKFQTRIYAGLQRVFASDTDSQVNAQWMKMADAISDIALDLFVELTVNAEVVPGIAVTTAGTAVAQTGATTSPGKIA
jgi:hypothetical protein